MPAPKVLYQDAGFGEVSIAVTTRLGGGSEAPFDSFNLASHVGDDIETVEANRVSLHSALNTSSGPIWLDQVHGHNVVKVNGPTDNVPCADASVTEQVSLPLAILTADCLPIVLWDEGGRQIAALHAGWRGLASSVIERTIRHFTGRKVSAFIGPGVGPCHYEVDELVRKHFLAEDAFIANRPGHYQFDLVKEARRQLNLLGVKDVRSMDVCTACDSRFYSFRRDGETGRFATLVWR
ncbi:MAG: YfiH family protein [Patiriisocius sp.]|jgi:YfiH family protein